MRFARYALYYLPPAGESWARFATRWLGWDCVAGRAVDPPPTDRLPRPLGEITAAPRRYGLHATIKPPFRLAEGRTQAELEAACTALCARLRPVRMEGLDLTALGRFLALRPVGDETALNTLAAACVRRLDPFRAPMTRDEHDRRAAGLRPGLRRNLDRWGYAHVMEEFRFHITLTGRLDKPARDAVRGILKDRLTPILPRPYTIGDLSLMGEDEDGRFHQIRRIALSG